MNPMTPTNRFTAILFLIICAALPLTASDQPPDIIIISVDTLRADHLTCYGYPLKTSPAIDSLAKDGLLYENCFTPTPYTVPGFASMLTSLYPHQHGAKRNGLTIFNHVKTLPHFLRRRGYASAAFISNWPLRKKLSGLHRDFDLYGEVFGRKRYLGIIHNEGAAPDVTRRAVQWLRQRPEGPFFLWVHYSEPHSPYHSHKGFDPHHGKPSSASYPPGTHYDKVRAYDSEIAFTDNHIGQLLKQLRWMNLYRRSLIIFNADHGESFGEHNYFKHGKKLYNASLHVPLIIKLPENHDGGSRIAVPATLLDVAPTLLTWIKEPVPESFQGKALLPLPPSGDRTLYFETYRGATKLRDGYKFQLQVEPIRYAVILNGTKLILNHRSGSLEAYRTFSDHHELKNIYAADSPRFTDLDRMVHAHKKGVDAFIVFSRKHFKQKSRLDEDDVERLRSLGYLD